MIFLTRGFVMGKARYAEPFLSVVSADTIFLSSLCLLSGCRLRFLAKEARVSRRFSAAFFLVFV